MMLLCSHTLPFGLRQTEINGAQFGGRAGFSLFHQTECLGGDTRRVLKTQMFGGQPQVQFSLL